LDGKHQLTIKVWNVVVIVVVGGGIVVVVIIVVGSYKCIILFIKPLQVLVRRMDGSVQFRREWQDYKLGFGSLTGEFWAGSKTNFIFILCTNTFPFVINDGLSSLFAKNISKHFLSM